MPALVDLNQACEFRARSLRPSSRTVITASTFELCIAAQQRRFNAFRDEFNHVRPHEALDQQPPASCYEPSRRPMPDRIPPLEYPDRFEIRYVSANGGIRWHCEWVNVSIVCAGENVGLEEIDNGVWNVWFGSMKIDRLLERHMRIEDAYGRIKRHRRLLPMSSERNVTYVPDRSANNETRNRTR